MADTLNMKLDVLKAIYSVLNKAFYPKTRTLTSSSYTGNATIAAGATQIIITTDGSYAGNINGVAGVASTIYRFDAPIGSTLPAVPVTRSAGGYTVTTVV